MGLEGLTHRRQRDHLSRLYFGPGQKGRLRMRPVAVRRRWRYTDGVECGWRKKFLGKRTSKP